MTEKITCSFSTIKGKCQFNTTEELEYIEHKKTHSKETEHNTKIDNLIYELYLRGYSINEISFDLYEITAEDSPDIAQKKIENKIFFI